MSQRSRFPEVALFDLDGTLLDSAPDMLATVNVMRERRGIAPMTLSLIHIFLFMLVFILTPLARRWAMRVHTDDTGDAA